MDANVERFSGFAELYDAARPHLPAVALDVLCQAAGVEVPSLVVDLGAGTGLSSRIWMGRAGRIIGVEPNHDMRSQATASTPPGAVEYVDARSEHTGLPDESADIVTVGQALHWMDTHATFTEAARVLRRGGVFAAYDCDWPPFVHWALNDSWRTLRDTSERIVQARELALGLRRGDKAGHLAAMGGSGLFRGVSEMCFHARTKGDAEALIRLMRTQGGVATALKARDADAERALDRFERDARDLLGAATVPWTYTYRMRLAVK